MAIASISPASGESLRSFEPLDDAEIEAKRERAAGASREHRRLSFAERARRMVRAAEILEAEKDRFARLMTTEMGKPRKAAGQGSDQMRLGLPVLRGTCRATARRRIDRHPGRAELRPVSAAGADLGGDLETSH